MITKVLIDGELSDGVIPVTDSSVLRGDGCFEVIRAYRGIPFTVSEHVERLGRSAAMLDIELPPASVIEEWVSEIAREVGDGAVRVVVTRGASVPGLSDPPRVVVFGHGWDPPDGPVSLEPVEAPWHPAGSGWRLAGAKTLSYAPNLAASRAARASGGDDALLVGRGGVVLEGPTFSVAWVVDGVLETPGLELGILDSITRRIGLDDARAGGVEVIEGVWTSERLADADEIMAMSTLREIQPVDRVGTLTFEPGPVAARIAERFARRVAGTTTSASTLEGT